MKSQPTKAGFTLIELLIVIMIILVLVGMLIPVMGMIKKYNMGVKNDSLLQKVHAGVLDYAQIYNAWPVTHADPITDNALAKWLCTAEGSVSRSAKTSSVLTETIPQKQIVGEAIVDYDQRRPLIFISGVPGLADGRTEVPLPEQLASDATDMTQTFYTGYSSVFELFTAGPDGQAAAIRNDPVNADNRSVTEPYGKLGVY